MPTVGYARVSTADQNVAAQTDALRAAGCEQIYTDQGVSGAKRSRPQFDACLDALRPGDTLVVHSLSRAGRSLANLLELTTYLRDKGVAFRSLTESIATGTATGDLMLHVLAALAQFERSLVMERCEAGRVAARARGKRFGPRPKLTPGRVEQARALRDAGRSVPEIADLLGCHRNSVYRVLGPTV